MRISSFNQQFLKHAMAVDSLGKPKKNELAHGLCYYWAHVFAKVIGGKCVTVGTKNLKGEMAGHMMVLYNGNYYDAENLIGRKTPIIYRSISSIWTHLSAEDAQKFWKTPKSELAIHSLVIKKMRSI